MIPAECPIGVRTLCSDCAGMVDGPTVAMNPLRRIGPPGVYGIWPLIVAEEEPDSWGKVYKS